MQFEVVAVKAYSGYRVNERPVSFHFRGREYIVQEIIDRWYEGGPDSGSVSMDYFKVLADDGREYILRYNGLFDAWAVMIQD